MSFHSGTAARLFRRVGKRRKVQAGVEQILPLCAFDQLVFEETRIGEVKLLSILGQSQRQWVCACGDGGDVMAVCCVKHDDSPVALVDDIEEPSVAGKKQV